MPTLFFAKPVTDTKKFEKNTRSITSADYYPFNNYLTPKVPSPSEMVICRNEDNRSSTIITPRLVFRSLDQIDRDDLISGLRALLQDPENVTKFWDGAAWTDEEIEEYIQKYTLAWETGKRFSVYAIYDASNPDRMIGALDFCQDHSFTDKNLIALGYIILKSEHGKGLGYEIGEVGWQAFVHEVNAAIASGQIPFTALAATAHPGNHASIKILNHVLGDADLTVKMNYGVDQPRLFFKRKYELETGHDVTGHPEYHA